MKITIIGAGYVGLVTATCFAELGNEVMCVESVRSKLEMIAKGIAHFYEPDLEEILKKNIRGKRMHFSNEIKEGVEFSDILFLCVATPTNPDGKSDLSQIEYASRNIAEVRKQYTLIIEKSTVPVNTHKWVKKTVHRYSNKNIEFDVASNPEFLRESTAIHDFMNPDRIIIGVESEKAANILRELYKPLTEKGVPLLITNPATAEMIKHASNSFLALKISYANMLAQLTEKVGVDIQTVIDGMGFDQRIGRSFLNPGIGYGGSCFPKDVHAFVKIADDHFVDFGILKEAEKINLKARMDFIKRIDDILWINNEKNIAVWGLSFKPNTDDIREAPSIDIVKELKNSGANLFLYDPVAHHTFKKHFPEDTNLKYCDDRYDALINADALLILTEWDEFKNSDLKKMKACMRLPIIIDGRNIFKPEYLKENGFEYYSIGRNSFVNQTYEK